MRATRATSRHPDRGDPRDDQQDAGDRYRAWPLAEDQHASQRRQQRSGAAPDRVDERQVTDPVAELEEQEVAGLEHARPDEEEPVQARQVRPAAEGNDYYYYGCIQAAGHGR